MKRGYSFGFEAEEDSDGEPSTSGLRRAVKRLNTAESWNAQRQEGVAAEAQINLMVSSERPGVHNYGANDLASFSGQPQNAPSISAAYYPSDTPYPGTKGAVGTMPNSMYPPHEFHQVNGCEGGMSSYDCQESTSCPGQHSSCIASYTEMNDLLGRLHFERVQRAPGSFPAS